MPVLMLIFVFTMAAMVCSDTVKEAVLSAPFKMWKLCSTKGRTEFQQQRAFKKCKEQFERIGSLVNSAKRYASRSNTEDQLQSVWGWWSAVYAVIRDDEKLSAVPEFVQQHLDPIEKWLTTFNQLAANDVAIAQDALKQSAALMLPQFQERLIKFYHDLHSADIAALKTADADIAAASSMLRKPLSRWARRNLHWVMWGDRDAVDSQAFQCRTVSPEPVKELFSSAAKTCEQIRESIERNKDWSAAQPFLTQYSRPFLKLLTHYYRLKFRKIEAANDVLADIESRVLPMYANSLVAFHNQMHVNLVAALQTTDVELSAEVRPAANAEANAPAAAEASA